jgi:hypothetical protein
MTSKVKWGARPKSTVVADTAAADAFVQAGTEKPVAEKAIDKPAEKPKRLTIDIEPALHKRLKARAAEEDSTIADIARKLLKEWAYR